MYFDDIIILKYLFSLIFLSNLKEIFIDLIKIPDYNRCYKPAEAIIFCPCKVRKKFCNFISWVCVYFITGYFLPRFVIYAESLIYTAYYI